MKISDLGTPRPDSEDSDYKAVEANLSIANDALESAIRAIAHLDPSLPPPSSVKDKETLEYFTAIALEKVIANMDSGSFGIGIYEVTALEMRRIGPQRKLGPALKSEAKMKGNLFLGIERGDLLGYPEIKGTWFLIFTNLAGETCLAPIDKIIKAKLKVVRKKSLLVGEREPKLLTTSSQTARPAS